MPDPQQAQGEQRMMPRLLAMLRRSGRLRPGAVLATELPWHGRRVDLATLSASDVLSAYELKLGSFGRVMEQAVYNQLSFDRSWMVVGAIPGPSNLELARRHRIGVISVTSSFARILIPAPSERNDPVLRRRLVIKMRSLGSTHV